MKHIISILIDGSGSMGRTEHNEKYRNKYLVAEKTRMDLTKVLLNNEIVPAMTGVDEVITHTFKTNIKTKKAECYLVQSCAYDIKQISQGINQIPEPLEGGTPITEALKQNFNNLLSSVTHEDRKMIILITDGDENGEGDYTKTVKYIGSCACEVHIIGLDLNLPLKKKAILAASSTGGTFTDVEIPVGASFNSVVVSATQSLLQLKQALSKFVSGNKSDVVITETEDDAQLNEQIRSASEGALFRHLRIKHGDRVHWLNDPVEKGDDHDFEILEFGSDEPAIYIECKGTPGNKPTFYLTANEWRLALKHGSKYELYFIQNCFDQPKFTQFINLMTSLESGNLLPYSLEEEHLQAKRIAITVAST